MTDFFKQISNFGSKRLPHRTTEEDHEAMALAAVAKSKANQFLVKNHLANMKDWVDDGPVTFKALALLGGILMTISGFFGFVGVLFSPLHGVIEAYICIFGIATVMLEAKNVMCKEGVKEFIARECKFLTKLSGRGYFYIFVGTLLLSQWPQFGDVLIGFYMTFVGVFMTIVGFHAKAKVEKIRGHIKDEKVVMQVFKNADKDGNGSLTPEELADLCKSLGSELTKNELLTYMTMLDTDNSNSVELTEFMEWWQSTTAEEMK